MEAVLEGAPSMGGYDGGGVNGGGVRLKLNDDGDGARLDCRSNLEKKMVILILKFENDFRILK